MEKLFSNISFIGGIHGVGKSTICNIVCTETNLVYLSASEVLKWAELNEDQHNKNVQDIPSTQNRLIQGLCNKIDNTKRYLLDGHYCLLDKNYNITKVPIETFTAINPISLHIIIGDIQEIKDRLELRDNKMYDYALLEEMQKQEQQYAEELADFFDLKLNIGKQEDFSSIITALK